MKKSEKLAFKILEYTEPLYETESSDGGGYGIFRISSAQCPLCGKKTRIAYSDMFEYRIDEIEHSKECPVTLAKKIIKKHS